jgi:hypothetical protein
MDQRPLENLGEDCKIDRGVAKSDGGKGLPFLQSNAEPGSDRLVPEAISLAVPGVPGIDDLSARA